MFDFVCCEQDSYYRLGPRSYIAASRARYVLSWILQYLSDLSEDWRLEKTIFSIVDEPPSCSDTGKQPSKCNIV